jgi:O-acetyl-ADP-ribose deacetylase (regulator of RNase III)/transposase InsO family protein
LITGDKSAPGVFQHLLEIIMTGLRPANLLIYIDDLAVIAQTKEEMMEKLQDVFNRLRGAKLRIHPQKSRWFVDRAKYLGFIFTNGTVSPDPQKLQAVLNFPRPTTQKRLRSFNGLTSWYRRFIRNYAKITEPFRELLKQDAKFRWSDDCEKAFQFLKQALTSPPILILPDFSKPMKISIDASISGLGYEISQMDSNGEEHPVAYGSRSTHKHERNYSISELELLSLIFCLKQNRTYFVNNHFHVVTDHASLTYINKMQLGHNPRLTRWALFLQEFRFTISFRHGRHNHVADSLSRMYEDNDERKTPNNNLENATESAQLQDKLPQQVSVSTQTDLAAAMIDNTCSADAPAEAQTAANDDCKQTAGTERPQRITIKFDHVNADLAVNAITSVEQTHQFPTMQQIQEELPLSADFADLYFYLLDGSLPDDDKKARTVMLQAPEFTLENGTLWHLYTPRTRKLDRAYSVIKRICLPEKFRTQVANALHFSSCHAGVDRTFALSRLKYYYPGQYTHLRKHVLSCEVCQKAKEDTHPQRAPIGELGLTSLGQNWNCDLHGPFTQTSEGHTHICVFTEQVSLWTEFYPLTQITAEAIVQAFLDSVISRFGAVKQLCLISDRGSAFISQLLALISKTFNVTQKFTAPYKHSQNSPAEVIGATINKSLRILCADHSQWHKALSMVALAYRSTPTAGRNLSPFEIWFGRRMFVETDFSLLSDANIADIVPSHLDEVRLRLKVLQGLALQNASENSERHRLKYNQNATIPDYKLGNKVLLRVMATKPHQCAKLQFKYKGPYLIEQILPNYHYRLKDLTSGKIMKNPVHADHLRHFNELETDNEHKGTLQDICVFDGRTSSRHISVKVIIENIVSVNTDAIVLLLDRNFDYVRGASKIILKLAGREHQQQCEEFSKQSGQPDILCLPAGSLLSHTKHIVHALLPDLDESPDYVDIESTLIDTICKCLSYVDKMTDVSTVTIAPIAKQSVGMDQWTLSHAMAKAICKFDEQTHGNEGQLKVVQFVNLCITDADVLCVVLKQLLLQDQQEASTTPSESSDQAEQPEVTNESRPDTSSQDSVWYPIKKILGRKRQRGKDLFLVHWEGTEKQEWIEKQFITDAALKEFYATRKTRKRRRRRY